jgi:hypothetical protein
LKSIGSDATRNQKKQHMVSYMMALIAYKQKRYDDSLIEVTSAVGVLDSSGDGEDNCLFLKAKIQRKLGRLSEALHEF